jgi:hypothetical protein
MIKPGWIQLHRRIFDHDMFDGEPMSSREAWIWLIANAAYRDTTHKVGSKRILVPRGSIVTTLRDLAAAFGWESDKRVRGFLARLCDEGMVEVGSSGQRRGSRTHIEILNYDDYQTSQKQDATTKPMNLHNGGPPIERERPPDGDRQRESLLAAMGADPSSRAAGTSSDMIEARKWSVDLGLTVADQVDVVREVMATRVAGDDPPNSFRFFTKAMTRRAGLNTAPALTPKEPYERKSSARSPDRTEQSLNAFVAGARSAS